MRLSRLIFASLTTLFVAVYSRPSIAAPEPRKNFPCSDCLFFPVVDSKRPVPLLVVLHGDAPGGKKPLVERDSAPFVKAANERGIAVFAPYCPKARGCHVGSYWQWTEGDPPAWLDKQIEIIRKDVAIDPDRIWIAGWSGGASFLGYRYPSLAGRYAAVIFAGGGMPPASPSCPPCSPPAYFLVGDKNPLHHLAKDLRKNVQSCTADVTWDLLPGKEHGGEWRMLGRSEKVIEMLDWLAKHPRTCPSPITPISSQSAAPESIPSAVVEARDDPRRNTPAEPPRIQEKSGSCAFLGSADQSNSRPLFAVLVALRIIFFRRRRMKKRQEAGSSPRTDWTNSA